MKDNNDNTFIYPFVATNIEQAGVLATRNNHSVKNARLPVYKLTMHNL